MFDGDKQRQAWVGVKRGLLRDNDGDATSKKLDANPKAFRHQHKPKKKATLPSRPEGYPEEPEG